MHRKGGFIFNGWVQLCSEEGTAKASGSWREGRPDPKWNYNLHREIQFLSITHKLQT